ncbi:DNA gyrase inhibitor YacG [Belnapia sp. T6]|uniref:DNA gyrase inhibitor YacG n=1 Tax=Belnapia mucosa TaxID=2804532 RepID=A0ABS1VC25_9PROT|nr:DNA gyrase inhibitor YacG [Belnapia mucosa]MBL6459227.1 DNA gyrase inhibitor YacG [Belnapia mucosa]
MADKPQSATHPCPVCGRPADPEGRFRPFCSARCRQVDLGRWLAEDYAIPGEPPALPGDDEERG